MGCALLAGHDGRDVVIELKNLTAINEEGEHLLLQLMKSGVKFRSSGVFGKHVLKLLARRTSRDAREKN